MIELTEQLLRKELIDNEKSANQLAEELGTYPKRIIRAAQKFGVPLRNHSEAQKLALLKGRIAHPSKGKKLSQTTRNKISSAVHKNWESITEEELERRKATARELWEKIPPEDKERMYKMAGAAIRKTADEGSSTEKALFKLLTVAGFKVDFHRKNLIINSKMEVDLFLPEERIVIEVDGPAHFFPVFGEESLQKHIKADTEKAGLLVMSGYKVIRVRHLVSSPSQYYHRMLADAVIKAVADLKTSKLPIIQVEV